MKQSNGCKNVKNSLLLEFPFTVVKRADLASLQPARDAVEVKGMLHTHMHTYKPQLIHN